MKIILEDNNKTMREENKKMRIDFEVSVEKKMNKERIINYAKHDELQAKIHAVHMNIILAIKGLGDIEGSTCRPTIEYSKNVD
jgi:hypothetical protein